MKETEWEMRKDQFVRKNVLTLASYKLDKWGDRTCRQRKAVHYIQKMRDEKWSVWVEKKKHLGKNTLTPSCYNLESRGDRECGQIKLSPLYIYKKKKTKWGMRSDQFVRKKKKKNVLMPTSYIIGNRGGRTCGQRNAVAELTSGGVKKVKQLANSRIRSWASQELA